MEENKASHRRKYPAAAPIGGIFVVLALIGLITVVSFSIQATTRLLDNSKEKEQFQQVILPVLMFDPVPFTEPAEPGRSGAAEKLHLVRPGGQSG